MGVSEAVAKSILLFFPLKQYCNETVLSEVSVWSRMSPLKEDPEGQELEAEC